MKAIDKENWPGGVGRGVLVALAIWVMTCQTGWGQVEPDLTTARTWIGRALFVRGFYAADELSYDAAGRVVGAPRVVDWTLAGMDVQGVERKSAGAIELSGVRVAIRYNPDNRFFERHPQKDERMKVTIAIQGSAGIEKTLGAIFAVGIDPAMQRSMPGYWLHYFQPGAVWQEDAVAGKLASAVNAVEGLPQGVTAPVAEKKAEPKYPRWAERDKVQGTVQMLAIVDEQGVPRHVAIARPLGYGLDAEAAEAAGRWRWRPAMRDGKAITAAVGVGQEFKLVTPPGR